MKKMTFFGVMGLGFLLVGLTGAFAEEQSQVVALADVPPAAQRTMQLESGNGKGRLEEIEKVQDDGETWYEATLKKGKVERTFDVGPDGKLISYQVFLHEIPEAARKAIRSQAHSEREKIGDINRVVEDGKTTFEVDLTKGDKEISFTVDELGKLLYIEIALEETPDAVQKAIHAKAGDAVIETVEKNLSGEDGEVVYDVDTRKGGKKISFSVDGDGKLIDD